MSQYILSFKYNLFLENFKAKQVWRYPWGWPQFCRIKLSWTSNQMSTTARKNPKLRAIQPVSILAPLRLMHEILQLVGIRIPILAVFADFIPSLQPIVSNHTFQVEVTSATLMVLPPFCSERFPFATVVGILSQLERDRFLNTELICSRSFKLASHRVVKHDM
jgi:hypothetical protein